MLCCQAHPLGHSHASTLNTPPQHLPTTVYFIFLHVSTSSPLAPPKVEEVIAGHTAAHLSEDAQSIRLGHKNVCYALDRDLLLGGCVDSLADATIRPRSDEFLRSQEKFSAKFRHCRTAALPEWDSNLELVLQRQSPDFSLDTVPPRLAGLDIHPARHGSLLCDSKFPLPRTW